MFKKLQNLLFEEEDDEIEEGELETPVQQTIQQPVEAPVAPKPVIEQPVQQPVLESAQQPILEPAHPAIDPVVEPVQSLKVPEQAVEAQQEEVPEEKQVPFGITLDDKKPEPIVEEKPVKAEPVRKPKVDKPVVDSNAYQFKPVISPIFGVDEKDLTAVKNTARKYNNAEKIKNDGNVTPVLSPIYGSNEANSPSLIQDTVERSEMLEKTVGNANHFKAEDDIPEFSLDDILLVRDNEYKQEIDPEIPDELDDATMVFDKTKFPNDEGLD